MIFVVSIGRLYGRAKAKASLVFGNNTLHFKALTLIDNANELNRSKSEPQKNRCSCGNEFLGKFCPECGKAALVGWTCSCGATNTGKFCSECGKKKPETDGYFCECGYKSAEPFKFCPECGKKQS